MLTLGLITPNAIAAQAIEQLVGETGGFAFTGSLNPTAPLPEVLRLLRIQDPELLLVDLNEGTHLEAFLSALSGAKLRAKFIGFRESWTRQEQMQLEEVGVKHLLREPFSPADLDAAIYTVIHGGGPVPRPGVFAFLPAKAGGGCSTATLHVAASLASTGKKVVLMEADVRSGTFSMMLNLRNQLGMQEILQRSAALTVVDWQQMHVTAEGIDLLLADPRKPAGRASWSGYYQILQFAGKNYDYVVADLPEVINDATVEIARTAESVFVVCTPEVLSLRLASLRCQEVEAYGIPKERVKVVVTRFQRDGISAADVERSVGRPVFATLANDYFELHQAILEYRTVSPKTAYGRDTQALARKITGAADEGAEKSRFGLLRKFGR